LNIRRTQRDEVELNLTPLIDVVFLLLIFFMVTTSFNKLAALKITLPEAVGEQSEAPAKQIEVAIDQNGQFFINSKALVNSQSDTIRRAIEKEANGQLDIPFIISGDAKTDYELVVRTMSVAQGLGMLNLSFQHTISTDAQ
jgi:biopolymer transport protein ExbD